ncbi:MAG: ECF transporter S component [Actinomycetota bacterium]
MAFRPSAAERAIWATSDRPGWRTIDVVVTAMLGVVFGVAYWGWNFVYAAIDPALKAFPPASGLLAGPWLIAGVVGALVVRRPGAALGAELLAANVSFLIGNQWGVATLISGALQGIGVEVAFLLVGWRRFGPVVAALGGALAATVESVYEWFAYWDAWQWGYKFAYWGLFVVSGIVAAGWGGWILVRALARAGALDAFPIGRMEQERRLH